MISYSVLTVVLQVVNPGPSTLSLISPLFRCLKQYHQIFHHSILVEIYGPSYQKHQGKLLQEEYG